MAKRIVGDTWIGGHEKSFATTRWSDLYRARTQSEDHRKKIIQKLITIYWKPVYCYLRRRGYQNEAAKDLTQAFFCEVVLHRQLIQQATHSKGRFRAFLLAALDRYLIDVYRRESAAKRCPEVQFSVLSDTDKIDELSTHGKAGEHDEACDRSFARHASAAHGVSALGDGQKCRDGGEGVNQKKDRTERQHREAH